MAASSASVSPQVFKQIWKTLALGKTFDKIFQKVDIVSASASRCRCELIVEEEHMNGQGTLHGGFVMSLSDYATSLALVTSTNGQLGVSVEHSLSFLRSARLGDKVAMEAEVIKAGKTLAFTKAELFNAGGELIATSKHTIYTANIKTVQEIIKSMADGK